MAITPDSGVRSNAAIDLAGRDVFEAVQVSVNPKVITTPKVAAMAKDGIQLLAVARVTVPVTVPVPWAPAERGTRLRAAVRRRRPRKEANRVCGIPDVLFG